MTSLTPEDLMLVGRDREAVVAALGVDERSTTMNPAEQLAALAPVLSGLVRQIAADDLSVATPCASYDVAGVLAHMVAGATAFAPAFRGVEPGAPLSGDVRTQWFAAMEELVGAVTSDGALDRSLTTPFGPLMGAAFAQYVVFDGLVHGWDLSQALGLGYAPPAGVVDAVHAALPELVPDPARDGDTFAAATAAPPTASRLEEIVAFSGRAVAVS